jgi:GTPase involved in cell partitioning and DNA repair
LSLKPQEIRQALNQAGLGVKFLADIAENEVFKNVVGISNERMAGQELALRFMAFKTLGDDKFKIMNNFLDLAMEKIDAKSEQELRILQSDLIAVLEFSEQVLGEKHRFSRSIVDEERNKLVNLSLFDALTVCLDEVENKDLFLENKDFFVTKFKKMLLDESSDLVISITKGTSGKWAKDTRFRIIRDLIAETLE